MSKKSGARKRIDDVNAAIWLIGLGVLFLTDLFWPGILILAGISIIVRSMMMNNLAEEEASEAVMTPAAEPTAPAPPAEPAPTPEAEPDSDEIPDPLSGAAPARFVPQDPSWLPAACPACGGPLETGKMLWKSETSAECPYCHTLVEPGQAAGLAGGSAAAQPEA